MTLTGRWIKPRRPNNACWSVSRAGSMGGGLHSLHLLLLAALLRPRLLLRGALARRRGRHAAVHRRRTRRRRRAPLLLGGGARRPDGGDGARAGVRRLDDLAVFAPEASRLGLDGGRSRRGRGQ